MDGKKFLIDGSIQVGINYFINFFYFFKIKIIIITT